MTHTFSKGMEEIIRDATGMSVDEIRRADHETVQRSIEKKIGHKLRFGLGLGLVPRNMLLAEGRVIFPEELEPSSVFATLIRLVWLYVAFPFKRVFRILISKLFVKEVIGDVSRISQQNGSCPRTAVDAFGDADSGSVRDYRNWDS